MSFVSKIIDVAERVDWPDSFINAGIRALVGRTRRQCALSSEDQARLFARSMDAAPIALNTREANEQHYELPAEFFALILGPHRKYSCCLFEEGDDLAAAERRALEVTCEHAAIEDGQRILELGCGWGSLSLWLASHYPAARITSVSNSHSQRQYIEAEARARGYSNLRVLTADMNEFGISGAFDRIVSVEMFEHMSNWRGLLARARKWVEADGRMFLHVFSHRTTPYKFDSDDPADWIAQHFFTGGIMPSHDLIRQYDDSFRVEQDWQWNGRHYERTARIWLENFDRNRAAVDLILRDVYKDDADLWRRRWRLFFLATAGLFGHADGKEWGVSHYRLKPV